MSVAECDAISVQVLNEFVNATAKKLKIPRPEIDRALELIDKQFPDPLPLTRDVHRAGLTLCRDHRIAFCDALIVAAAIEAGCDRLFSEDLQHGRKFGDCVVVNPFLKGTRKRSRRAKGYPPPLSGRGALGTPHRPMLGAIAAGESPPDCNVVHRRAPRAETASRTAVLLGPLKPSQTRSTSAPRRSAF